VHTTPGERDRAFVYITYTESLRRAGAIPVLIPPQPENAADIAPWVGAGVLVAAGAYQLTPLKDFCLRHCRSPIAFLLHVSGYKGRLRDVRVGMYHGVYCVGCCWGLMLVLIAVGVMNLAWMAVLTVVIFLEKTWKYGPAFSRITGVSLIVFARFVPAHPELLPGLYMPAPM